MNKDNFYIDDLASIRAFCINSDKEDIYKYIYSLQQENKQLKDNWNKLKQYLSNGVASNNYFITENCMLTKMQELEKSNSNE